MIFNEFNDYLSKVVGLTSETCTKYYRTLNKFMIHCNQNNIVPSYVTSQEIIAYIDNLPVGPGQKQHYLCVIKRYYQFLIYSGFKKENPTKEIKPPKRPPSHHLHYSIEDIVRLIQSVETTTSIGIRNQILITLLYATGMRCTELARLKLVDVDLNNQAIKVFGKNAKERLIPLNIIAVSSLEYYFPYRNQLGNKSPYIFTTCQQNHSPLSRTTIWKIVKNAAEKAGLDSTFTTHSLRHAFATHMLNNGANLRVVQQLLGHAMISTTQLYTHLDNHQLKALHQKCHPRA